MEKIFSEELIYAYNNKLKDGDLEKLYKLSYFYDVFDCLDWIFHYDFQTILNYLVLNELPYSIASKLMFDNKRSLYAMEEIRNRSVKKTMEERLNRIKVMVDKKWY